MSLGQAVTSFLLAKPPQLMKHVPGLMLSEEMLARSLEQLLKNISQALQALVYTSGGSGGAPRGDQVPARQRLQSQR